MNDRYGDNRGDRWRDRGQYGRGYDRGERSSYGSRDYGQRDYGRDDDRGFMDRAGDEVRSWFGDEEAERRREADARRYQSEQGYGGGRMRSNRDDDYGTAGYRGTAGGWGNQSADSWNRDRPGERSGSYDRSYLGGSDYDRDQDRGSGRYSDTGGDWNRANTWGPSPFGAGEDSGRRFDRIDAGSTGTHGAHPYSNPSGGGYGGGSVTASGGISRGSGSYGARRTSGYGGGRSDWGGQRSDHDPHYSEWRNRQIESLDRDYDNYRREHQSKFEQEFGNWRSKRTEQRQSLGRVTEHAEVVGSDGEHIGTVDKVRGDRIILTKNDQDAGGHHHSIPCSWIESVDDKITINKTAAQAKQAWRDEENNRALFEGDDQGQGNDGPHTLNRSFSGTY